MTISTSCHANVESTNGATPASGELDIMSIAVHSSQ